MKSSDIPTKFPIPFANNAGTSYIRDIESSSQIGITDGKASLYDGFPPICFIETTAGGVPPSGMDMNGLLKQVTSWTQWQNAGATVTFDSDFSDEISGYPKGAIVASASSDGLLWLSVADENTDDPDDGSDNWLPIWTGYVSQDYAVDSGSGNAYAVTLAKGPSAYTDGMLIRFRATHTNTGTATMDYNELGARPMLAPGGYSTVAGQIVSGGTYLLQYSSISASFHIVGASHGFNPGVVRGTITVTADTTLAALQAGSFVECKASSAVTLTLPDPTTCPNAKFYVMDAGNYDLTVSTASGTFIGSIAGGASSVTVAATYGYAEFTSIGSYWVMTGDVNQATIPSTSIPKWRTSYISSASASSPSSFSSLGDGYYGDYISNGSIFYSSRSTASVLFEMKINSSGENTVYQKLQYCDDIAYFYLNDTLIAQSASPTWDLVDGDNTLQIVLNNTGSYYEILDLHGDLFSQSDNISYVEMS